MGGFAEFPVLGNCYWSFAYPKTVDVDRFAVTLGLENLVLLNLVV
jgi:hypothetical protein